MADVTYDELLQTLSEGSVRKHFDAFQDIAWDDPAYALDPSDPRWALPASDPLGAHPWYQALPLERRIEIGLWKQAQMCKVGLHFENLLIRGLMQYVFSLPNGDKEFRYVTHEATEETHHTQMFQEFVNRTGVEVTGIRDWTKNAPMQALIPAMAQIFPEFFFSMVLGGEEPIDHMQKVYLRASADELHPLIRRIVQIHVAEEARHISFAHRYLEEKAPAMGPVKTGLLSVLYPLAMRIMCDMILTPSRKECAELGIPREVAKEIWWDSPESRDTLSEIFGDVRMLAEKIGIMNPVSRRLWKAFGIAGRPSRYRGETHERAVHASAHGHAA
jgi:hypothetical protein